MSKGDINISYSGQKYLIEAPDTLNLAERARLAINGLGGTIDTEMDYQLYFIVRYCDKKPFMYHYASDTTLDPKFAESFPMMRLICGSSQYLEMENLQRRELLSRIKDDLYWNYMDSKKPWRSFYRENFDKERKDEDFSNVLAVGRMIRAMMTWKDIDGSTEWDPYISSLIRGLEKVAINKDDYSYYPDGGFGEPFNYPRSGWVSTNEAESDIEGGEGSVMGYQGNQIQVLSKWYRMTGDKKALELAGRLTKYCMLPKFWGGIPDPDGNKGKYVYGVVTSLPDPVCVSGSELGHWFSHFHMRAVALRGILEYAITVNDWRIMEFVKRAYEYAMTMGIPRMGWINCYPAAANLMESCALGDLIALAIKMSDAGVGDYWDDVDAIVRNQLVESQLVDEVQLRKISEASDKCDVDEGKDFKGQYTEESVIQRSLGNFAGQTSPVGVPKTWVMQCCTGNATQGLYYAWEGIVREDNGTAHVNLLLNRVSKGLDILSYLPYEGKAVFRIKTIHTLSVRIPGWVDKKTLRLSINGNRVEGIRAGQYITVLDLKSGDNVVIEFELYEQTSSYTVNAGTKDEQKYTCTFRGSTLIDISPRDLSEISYKLYNRDHMKNEKVETKLTEFYLPDNIILNW